MTLKQIITMKHFFLTTLFLLGISIVQSFSQENLIPSYIQDPRNPANMVVRPREINDVLMNPGIGFMTFQRFNGDDYNKSSKWSESFPAEYQPFDGNLTNKDHPATTIAYWRVYWKFFEPEMGKYTWKELDKALEVARLRGQTLLLRIMPYDDITGTEYSPTKTDVPDWYRKIVGPAKKESWETWAVDPEDPRYIKYFGRMIKALGERYDGHPDLEAVDLSIVGPWGEGAGSELLSQTTMNELVDDYTGSFRKTPLIALLMDKKTNTYAKSKIQVGWRLDCLGDIRTWANEENYHWSHMTDRYPMEILSHHLQNDWENSPVSFEICGTFLSWRDRQKVTREELKWIFDLSLKWHMSSFNAKSSPVPEEWRDLVDDWLKKMGYRYVIRWFVYPKTVYKNGKLPFYSLWENIGVAPCYKDYTTAVRIKSKEREEVYIGNPIIKEWLPGQFAYNDSFFVPADFPAGTCDVQIAIVDKQKHIPRVNLAIEGKQADGWYQLGKITIAR